MNGQKNPKATARPQAAKAGQRLRRLRGWWLRLAFHRGAAMGIGVLMLVPAILLLAGDYAWESWLTDGLALLLAATGIALILAGLGGRRPDWIDPEGPK